MKIATQFEPQPTLMEAIQRIVDLEGAGLDQVLVPESYGFDALTIAGQLAARTQRLEIGTGIINVFSRSAALVAMSAATLDEMSGGRFVLGLGASGPQVIEGFHGIAYRKPVARVADYTAACRMTWRREPLVVDGAAVTVPLANTAEPRRPLKLINRPQRAGIPIYWASIMPRAVTDMAATADGWLPAFFMPEKHLDVWGDDLQAGLARRPAELGPLQITAGGIVAIGEMTASERAAILDIARPNAALYIGGMGAPGKNFYNTICQAYGFAEAAAEVQDRFLSGDREGAARAIPNELLESMHLVGSVEQVTARVEAYRAAGVDTLLVDPVGDAPGETLGRLRAIIDRVEASSDGHADLEGAAT